MCEKSFDNNRIIFCDFQLSEVKLEELDPVNTPTTDMSAGFARPLEKNPLRVSYQDGLVEHLCPTAAEPTWVMNVKRGIVSMIQNNMDDFAKNKTVTEVSVIVGFRGRGSSRVVF